MNKQDNYKLFYDTIKALSCSQGRYGRMLRELDSLDEQNKQGLINQLPNFKDTVDVILFIEQ